MLRGHPARRAAREWLWLAAAALLSLLWVLGSGGLADQAVNAMAVLMTGAFIAISATDQRPAFTRAAWSVLVASRGDRTLGPGLGHPLARCGAGVDPAMVGVLPAIWPMAANFAEVSPSGRTPSSSAWRMPVGRSPSSFPAG